MRVVDAGCGWGSLALYMARHYGVRVGPSTSLASRSPTPARRAREAAADRVEFIEDDYRASRHLRRFASVGMLEHVGEAVHGARHV